MILRSIYIGGIKMAKKVLASIFDKDSNEFIPVGLFDSYKEFIAESKKFPDVKFFDSEVVVGKMDIALIADYK
jgi:hypothetical protein